jgi:nucleoside 2-deoxyribosyltransferase
MKIYLAIPYTWNPEASFRIANKVSAQLMSDGHIVFSPISHSHPIADHLPDNLRTDSHWWMNQDLPFVEWADKVYVVSVGESGEQLIESSSGVQMEIKHAEQNNIPIHVINFYE